MCLLLFPLPVSNIRRLRASLANEIFEHYQQLTTTLSNTLEKENKYLAAPTISEDVEQEDKESSESSNVASLLSPVL